MKYFKQTGDPADWVASNQKPNCQAYMFWTSIAASAKLNQTVPIVFQYLVDSCIDGNGVAPPTNTIEACFFKQKNAYLMKAKRSKKKFSNIVGLICVAETLVDNFEPNLFWLPLRIDNFGLDAKTLERNSPFVARTTMLAPIINDNECPVSAVKQVVRFGEVDKGNKDQYMVAANA